MGKTECKGPHGKFRLRWKDNIPMDLKEIGLVVVDSINLASVCGSGDWQWTFGGPMKFVKFLQ